MSELRERRGVAFLARYMVSLPLAWLGVAAIAGLHVLFAVWFEPPLAVHALAGLVDAVCLGVGISLALRSPAFAAHVNRAPQSRSRADLERHLKGCEDRFQRVARECLALIDNLGKEFQDQTYQAELGNLMGNLSLLADSNAELTRRSLAFGTPEQKRAMVGHLDAHVASLRRMKTGLDELAGNLALIEATADQQSASTVGLRDVNRGLEELLKELSHDA